MQIPRDHHPMLSSRLWRGVFSAVANICWPMGCWWLARGKKLESDERLEHGLAIILPGVEGRSPLNWNIALGLNDAGFAGAIRVVDWTTGFWPNFVYHLRAAKRNRLQASAIAEVLADYRRRFPNWPTYLLGHSGGGALVAWVLEALADGNQITAAAMLGPALRYTYPLGPALERVKQGLWHYWTPLDVAILGIGTLIGGNLDGRHAPSAGWVGFRPPCSADARTRELYSKRLKQVCFHPRMLTSGHLGGHMSWAQRLVVAEIIAPALFSSSGLQSRVAA